MNSIPSGGQTEGSVVGKVVNQGQSTKSAKLHSDIAGSKNIPGAQDCSYAW